MLLYVDDGLNSGKTKDETVRNRGVVEDVLKE
eukprot:COSAG02_NODE_483_length_21396_cov_20.544801_4_plen_32_part_00